MPRLTQSEARRLACETTANLVRLSLTQHLAENTAVAHGHGVDPSDFPSGKNIQVMSNAFSDIIAQLERQAKRYKT